MFTKIKRLSVVCLATTLLLSLTACETSVIRGTSESMPVHETNNNFNVLSTNDIKQKHTVDLYYFEYKTKRLYTNKELNTLDINKQINESGDIEKTLSKYGEQVDKHKVQVKNYVFNTVTDFEAVDKVQHLLYLQTTGITGFFLVAPIDESPDLYLEYDLTNKSYNKNNDYGTEFAPTVLEKSLHDSSILEMNKYQLVKFVITPKSKTDKNDKIMFLVAKIVKD